MVGALTNSFHHEVHNIVNMCSPLGRGDAVDKADLLKGFLRDTDGDLPPMRTNNSPELKRKTSPFSTVVMNQWFMTTVEKP